MFLATEFDDFFLLKQGIALFGAAKIVQREEKLDYSGRV
jgi:hypothetical protein